MDLGLVLVLADVVHEEVSIRSMNEETGSQVSWDSP